MNMKDFIGDNPVLKLMWYYSLSAEEVYSMPIEIAKELLSKIEEYEITS